MQFQDYLTYYGFNPQLHRFYRREFIRCQNLQICCHYFYPAKFEEVIVLVHGYLDHTGNMRNLVNYLVKQGFAVASFDLPGHGLSEGERGYIDDFSVYAECLDDFLETLIFPDAPVKKSIIAHSTGCSALIEYLRIYNSCRFREIIFAAPLIRSANWSLTMFGLFFVKIFSKKRTMVRHFRPNSSDLAYLKFRANDPLQPHTVSLAWLQALINWNKQIVIQTPFEQPVSIIQGNQDITVEWEYNLGVVKKLFPAHKLQIIKGANHQLFNESPLLMNKSLAVISDFLAEQFVFQAY